MKRFLKKLLALIIRIIGPFLSEELEKVKLEVKRRELLYSKRGINSVGSGVRLNGQIFISAPECVAIGNNVHIGADCYWRTDGGLTIGDNTHISRNVIINTTTQNYEGSCLPYDGVNVLRPVSIGKNVWIGMNVCIAPGTSIGDGAVICLGAVVSGDIPERGVVVSPKAKVVEFRNADRDRELVRRGRIGGIDGHPIRKSVLSTFRKKADAAEIFFVVSTGRSGTTTLARVLDSHSQIECYHERWPQLIRLSQEFAHGKKDQAKIAAELRALYIDSMVYPHIVYGESDHCLFNLVGIVSELIPNSKFVWLIRDARKVVASTTGRGWFDPQLEKTSKPNRYGTRDPWFYYRIHGDKSGDVTEEEWVSMSRFQKNCWYWKYVNEMIKGQFRNLSDHRKFTLRLEDLNSKLNGLQEFLGVENESLIIKRHNVAQHPKYPFEQWTNREKELFEEMCGQLMNEFYPGWEKTSTLAK